MIPHLSTVLAMHEFLCAALFYSTFCRAVRAGEQTSLAKHTIIRILGAVACLGMAAPLAFRYRPDWFTVILLAVVIIEVRASNAWMVQKRQSDELA